MTVCWWPVFLDWMLLLVLYYLQTLDLTGMWIEEYVHPTYICTFRACFSSWSSLQLKYLLTRGIFISVILRSTLVLGVVRTMQTSVLCWKMLSGMLCRMKHLFFLEEAYMQRNIQFLLVLCPSCETDKENCDIFTRKLLRAFSASEDCFSTDNHKFH